MRVHLASAFRGTRGGSGASDNVLTSGFHVPMVPWATLDCSPVSPTVSPKINFEGWMAGAPVIMHPRLARAGRQFGRCPRPLGPGYIVDASLIHELPLRIDRAAVA